MKTELIWTMLWNILIFLKKTKSIKRVKELKESFSDSIKTKRMEKEDKWKYRVEKWKGAAQHSTELRE